MRNYVSEEDRSNLNVRIDREVIQRTKDAAKEARLPLNEYIEGILRAIAAKKNGKGKQ